MVYVLSAFWGSLGAKQVSVPTNIVVNFSLHTIFWSKFSSWASSGSYRNGGGP